MNFTYLEVHSLPSKQIEDLLTSNVIGTPGLSMLYQHQGVKQKLYSITNPYFVSVRKNNTLIGTCCFCERNFNDTLGFYVRYFAFHNGFRLKSIPHPQLRNKKSMLRSEIVDLLNGKKLLSDARKPFFHYAYVDPRNPRSANLCEEFGFVPIRKYTTRLFSRMWPKPHVDLAIKQASPSSEKIHVLLREFYKGYNHFGFENLTRTYYYVEDERGDVVAGVQVNPDAWRILTLPGANGKALLNFFHHMPLLSRLLSKQFRFLAVEGIYYRTGQGQVFERLLETLLHQRSLHTAIMVVDTESSLNELTKQINPGLLAKISPEVFGHVIARFQNVDEAFISLQKSRPSYISVHDLS